MSERAEFTGYTERVIDEIGYALGVGRSGVMRRLLGPLCRWPAARFGRIAARADAEAESSGISGGARRIVADLALTISSRGTESIPAEGPLLVVSNHPGALDSVALLSRLPRKDVKVLLSDVPFTRAFSAARRYFVYVAADPRGRTAALRASINHLRSGGALLVFAHGDVEPDPEASPGSWESIQKWSRSVEIMACEVPESRLQVAIVSGVLARKSIRNPIVRMRRSPARRQKLAEVLQLCRQMLFPRTVQPHVHISFAEPFRAVDLAKEEIMPALVRTARGLLEDHLTAWSIPTCPL
jgi:1-acyl-sn-glycerol-3-phosphate acyltransferase